MNSSKYFMQIQPPTLNSNTKATLVCIYIVANDLGKALPKVCEIGSEPKMILVP